jgi:hypothetical protein
MRKDTPRSLARTAMTPIRAVGIGFAGRSMSARNAWSPRTQFWFGPNDVTATVDGVSLAKTGPPELPKQAPGDVAVTGVALRVNVEPSVSVSQVDDALSADGVLPATRSSAARDE